MDSKLKNIIQMMLDYYGSIIPIASCECEEDGKAYIFVTTMSLLTLNSLCNTIGVERMDYYPPEESILIPRWKLAWDANKTKDIELTLKYNLGLIKMNEVNNG